MALLMLDEKFTFSCHYYYQETDRRAYGSR
jgi:hypothetical protein